MEDKILIDPFDRKIDYVRLSVIDQCNFQCFYCRPELLSARADLAKDYLSPEDIKRLFTVLGELGVSKVKITGGEPLLRKDILDIVHVLAEQPNISDLSLTTNGFFLGKLAFDLKERGLQRVNISLDSLTSKAFEEVTKTPTFAQVWQGIQAALEAGLQPVKLNVVLLKEINDKEVLAFARLTLEQPLTVRFIEMMPTALNFTDQKQFFCSNEWARLEIEKKFNLLPILETSKTGPARYYKIPEAKGHLGFISPLSRNFCDSCNRIRITARGELKLCLFGNENYSLLPAIRSPKWRDLLPRFLFSRLKLKPQSHHLEEGQVGNVASFVTIGG